MRTRLVGAVLTVGSLALALGIRFARGSILDSDNPLNQVSGTILYASAVYGGALFLLPRARPLVLAALATGFCWAVEFFQLTGLPADWSAHSTLARLVLGAHFDPADLGWYLAGVLPAALLHRWTSRSRSTA